MAKPDVPQDGPQLDGPQNDPLDDTTFDSTADATTHDTTHATTHDTTDDTTDHTQQLEQPVHSDTTERIDTTDRLDSMDATRAIGADERPSTDLFGNPVDPSDDVPAAASASSPASASEDREWPPVLPERPSGPHAPAIVLGLVCVVVAGIIFAQELGDLSVDWGDIGPVGIVVTGAVLVLFGLVGLLTSRRNSKTT